MTIVHKKGMINPIEVKLIWADFIDEYEVKVRIKIGDKYFAGILEMNE